MRLNRFIAQSGVCSRRKADDYIVSERVQVNGQIITDFSFQISETDVVLVAGKAIKIPTDFIYILLRKPPETVTTVSDTHGRKTVLDLVKIDTRVYPVGRLDFDTTGVLLLTNDGDLTNSLIHPTKDVSKEYRVLVDRILTTTELNKLRSGVDIEDYTTKPCEIGQIERLKSHQMRFVITLKEGKKRQIRRMIKAVKAEVVKLDRISFAGLTYTGLALGEYRGLTETEIAQLKLYTGIK
jgi:23S rRNA pseudouridine2605 synthase